MYLFIYLFPRPIYWFGTCGVFDDCQYIDWCVMWRRGGGGEGGGGWLWGAWSMEKPSCDTNSNCCSPRIG